MSAYTPPFRRMVLRGVALLSVLVLFGYGVFEARRVIEGPQVRIDWPKDGSEVGGPLIHITGETTNAAFFSINSAQAFVDGSGHFDEAISPPPGYTVFEVSAKDRFGRMQTKTIHITIRNYCSAYGQA